MQMGIVGDLPESETGIFNERSPDSSTNWTEIGSVGANITTYSDTTLTCGTPYFYRVRGYRSGDDSYSAYSNTANASTALCPLVPPWDWARRVSPTQINLSWTDASADETAFHIERSPDGSTGWTEIGTVDADVTTYSDTTLTCGTPYFYRVRGYRSADSSLLGLLKHGQRQYGTLPAGSAVGTGRDGCFRRRST